MKDYQRSRVYRWEAEYVHPVLGYGKSVPFPDMQKYVDNVWAIMGLDQPPEVKPLSRPDKFAGLASRQIIWLPNDAQWECVILHELAHSMTLDGSHMPPPDSFHGRTWVGLYIHLLATFLGFSRFELMVKASQYKIKFRHMKGAEAPVIILPKAVA